MIYMDTDAFLKSHFRESVSLTVLDGGIEGTTGVTSVCPQVGNSSIITMIVTVLIMIFR